MVLRGGEIGEIVQKWRFRWWRKREKEGRALRDLGLGFRV